MCKLEDGFKLCTCLDEKGIEADSDAFIWQLRRVNPRRPERMLIGKCLPNILTQNDEDLRIKILEQLNQRDCFDFDYSPQQDDQLTIELKNNNYLSYRYSNQSNSWEADKSGVFAVWKSRLEQFDNGKII